MGRSVPGVEQVSREGADGHGILGYAATVLIVQLLHVHHQGRHWVGCLATAVTSIGHSAVPQRTVRDDEQGGIEVEGRHILEEPTGIDRSEGADLDHRRLRVQEGRGARAIGVRGHGQFPTAADHVGNHAAGHVTEAIKDRRAGRTTQRQPRGSIGRIIGDHEVDRSSAEPLQIPRVGHIHGDAHLEIDVVGNGIPEGQIMQHLHGDGQRRGNIRRRHLEFTSDHLVPLEHGVLVHRLCRACDQLEMVIGLHVLPDVLTRRHHEHFGRWTSSDRARSWCEEVGCDVGGRGDQPGTTPTLAG